MCSLLYEIISTVSIFKTCKTYGTEQKQKIVWCEMDRRQRKTREAIFTAFIKLLSERDFNQITVAEIIKEADVGRATFYAHFETKDYLLKEMCQELFCHIFDSRSGENNNHKHIFNCDAPDSVFLHLFVHLEKNDNNILELLSCRNNDLFLRYFKTNLDELVKTQVTSSQIKKNDQLPENFVINHITSTFVETVRWWVDNGMKETSEEINSYFTKLVNF